MDKLWTQKEWNAFHEDCESICFDCGAPNPQHKIFTGVVLCDPCKKGHEIEIGEQNGE